MFCFDSFVRFQLEFINTFGLNFDEKQGGEGKRTKAKKKQLKSLDRHLFLFLSLSSQCLLFFFFIQF